MQKQSTLVEKTFRFSKSWLDIAQIAVNWANQNINVGRIKGISATLCHYNKTGMINIFYDTEINNEDILNQTSKKVLGFQIFRNDTSWVNHFNKQMKNISEINNKHQIISINNLQVNGDHNECFTIVFFTLDK